MYETFSSSWLSNGLQVFDSFDEYTSHAQQLSQRIINDFNELLSPTLIGKISAKEGEYINVKVT